MEKKKLIVLLLVCVVVFAGALGLSTLYEKEPAPEEEELVHATVVINEVMSANNTYADPAGRLLDYIELYNYGFEAADLSGYKLSDAENNIRFTFPQETVIAPGELLLLWCDSEDTTGNYLPFGISRQGDEAVYLYNTANVLVDKRPVPRLEADMAYRRRADGTWEQTFDATPGYPNTPEGLRSFMEQLGAFRAEGIAFSEVLSASNLGIVDSHGNLTDWIELYNPTDRTLELSGSFLTDDPAKPYKWQIGELTVEPGEYLVIPCTGEDGQAAEAGFALPRTGCTLLLSGALGNPLAQLEVPLMQADESYQLTADGTWQISAAITPGAANTPENHEAYLDARQPAGPLVISEVMPSNNRYLLQSDGEYYDWVELQNISDEAIDLSHFALSDDADRPDLFPLPQKLLQPGERIVIICSGNTDLTGKYIHAPFGLNYKECYVYVTKLQGGYCDMAYITDVPYQHSAGRVPGSNRIHYFTQPTPGAENGPGKVAIAESPFVQTPGGVYNGVTGVEVVLSGEGQIRYTLDGSLPTEDSTLYTQPFTLTKTTVLRAACFQPDKLPSDVLTESYILNENHTMPVVSVTADPTEMFGYSGIYTQYKQNKEIPCNVTLFDGAEGFSVDCGIKMHGHTGLQNPKKSFKLNFRGVYGTDYLSYPIYGEDKPQLYDSLCLRAGQDYLFAVFREELFVSLCQDMTDTVLTQESRFCILYINGRYWGIYNLKEAFSEMYYAQKRGVSEESVEMVQAPVRTNTDVWKLMQFLSNEDMTDPENYAYVCSQINIDSLIDWMIIQGYSTNGDIQQNLRYFRSTENGNRYEMALYDLDWAFYYHLAFIDLLSNDRQMNWQHLKITRNIIKNPEFREKFLARLSYHMENTLSVENVLAKIDAFEAELDPEMRRERERWNGSYTVWKNDYVRKLREFITKYDHMGDIVRRLRVYIGLTNAEKEKYFWRWA